MQKVKSILLAVVMFLMANAVHAQEGSLNAFSPYTFYGVGNLSMSNGASFDGMAGANIGFRSYMKTNMSNPAAFSADYVQYGAGVYGSQAFCKSWI